MPTVKPSVETGQRNAAFQLACTGTLPPARPPVNLFDLFDALQVRQHLIDCLSGWRNFENIRLKILNYPTSTQNYAHNFTKIDPLSFFTCKKSNTYLFKKKKLKRGGGKHIHATKIV